jgi:hypothetical protein
MSSGGEKSAEFGSESFWLLYRNWNAVASVAFAGANIVFPGSQLIAIGLALNIGQTIFGEVMRQQAKNGHSVRPSLAR